MSKRGRGGSSGAKFRISLGEFSRRGISDLGRLRPERNIAGGYENKSSFIRS